MQFAALAVPVLIRLLSSDRQSHHCNMPLLVSIETLCHAATSFRRSLHRSIVCARPIEFPLYTLSVN